MIPVDWVAFGAAFVALLTLVLQQFRLLRGDQRAQTRTANKLKVLYLCQTQALTDQDIIDRYHKQHPTETIDEGEIRKTIYQMLCDKTLLFNADDQVYEAASHSRRTE